MPCFIVSIQRHGPRGYSSGTSQAYATYDEARQALVSQQTDRQEVEQALAYEDRSHEIVEAESVHHAFYATGFAQQQLADEEARRGLAARRQLEAEWARNAEQMEAAHREWLAKYGPGSGYSRRELSPAEKEALNLEVEPTDSTEALVAMWRRLLALEGERQMDRALLQHLLEEMRKLTGLVQQLVDQQSKQR
jgi:hypothetical protein